ncbi:hypothetical protein HEP_00503100, partial [Hepatocystis sp. ex Piliocolobus tephrosceles]
REDNQNENSDLLGEQTVYNNINQPEMNQHEPSDSSNQLNNENELLKNKSINEITNKLELNTVLNEISSKANINTSVANEFSTEPLNNNNETLKEQEDTKIINLENEKTDNNNLEHIEQHETSDNLLYEKKNVKDGNDDNGSPLKTEKTVKDKTLTDITNNKTSNYDKIKSDNNIGKETVTNSGSGADAVTRGEAENNLLNHFNSRNIENDELEEEISSEVLLAKSGSFKKTITITN